MSEKAQRKKPGRKPGSRVTHGAYSLIARGEFPSKRRYIERWLSEVRSGLIHDLGPTETDLSTGQAILIDRIIGKLGILRCIEEHVREKGVMKGNELSPSLGKNHLGWANSLRLDLLALGISKKNGDRILSALELAAEIDAEKAQAGPGSLSGGRTHEDEGRRGRGKDEQRRQALFDRPALRALPHSVRDHRAAGGRVALRDVPLRFMRQFSHRDVQPSGARGVGEAGE